MLYCYRIDFLATEDQPSENFNLSQILLFYESYWAKYFRKVTEIKQPKERILNLKRTVYWVSEGFASPGDAECLEGYFIIKHLLNSYI